MNAQLLNDGTARWFDVDRARKYDEDTYATNGNHYSRATGSQWDHESVYHTAGNAWIKRFWSNYQGRRETFEVLGVDEAYNWLVRNDHRQVVPAEYLMAQEV